MKNIFSLFAIVLVTTIMGLLQGCRSTYHSPVPLLIDTGSNTESISTEARTISLKPGEKLSLDDAIRIARQNNPSLAAVQLRVAQAAAVLRHVQAMRGPQLSLTGLAGHYSDAERVAPPDHNGEPGVFAKDILGTELILSYPLYTGGVLEANERANRALLNASQYRYLRAQHELCFNVSKVFTDILARRSYLESLQYNLKAMQSHLARVSELIVAQKARELDRTRIKVRISDLQQKIIQTRNDLAVMNTVLANLMGVKDTSFEVVGELQSNPLQYPQKDQESLIQEAYSNREDLAALQEELNAQMRKVEAVQGEIRPQVAMFAGYGVRTGLNPDDEPSGTDRTDSRGRIGLSVSIPIWDSGLRKAKIDQAQAGLVALQKQVTAARQRVRMEIRTALLNLNSARERVRTSQSVVEQAREVLAVQQTSHRLGKATLTDVLEAQSALFAAQANYVAALAKLRIAAAELELASGGNFMIKNEVQKK
ncbi:MAG: TolC family protein [Lentisphaerae bacterium]|nr:MAG: TolC family protein [Lentisphaerota bacterium]